MVVSTVATYVSANTPVPSVPSSVTVTKTRTNQSSVSKTTAYSYYGNGLLASVTDFSGTALATTTSYTYDNFGNTISKTTAAPNTATPVLTNTYDQLGRYLMAKSISGSGVTKTESYAYNVLYDQLASATSSDGLTTTFAYDAFGRVTQTGLPDGNVIVHTISWDQSYGRYAKTSYRYHDWGKWSKKYFDVINREIRSESRGFNHQFMVSAVEYN